MNNDMYYNAHEGTPSFCLGHPSHPMRAGEMLCPICGTLAGNAEIGIYQVQKLLGTGRSGQAYLAVHQRSSQPVAIKLFLAEPEMMDLLDAARRELRVTTSLRHPSIISVFSSSTWTPEPSASGSSPRLTRDLRIRQSQPRTYLLTLCQYIPGTFQRFIAYYQQKETQRVLSEHGISLITLLASIIQQAGSALSAVHARGITHGALVPGNFLFAGHDRVWVADFGLARLHPPAPPYLAPELYAASHATTHGGNPSAYWRAVTPAADQYTFAVICQQLLSQLLPARDYEPLLSVLQRATQQRPERRYPNLDLFVQDLLTLMQPAYASMQRGQLGQSRQGIRKAHPTTPAALLQPAGPRVPLPSSDSGNYGPPTPSVPESPLTPALPATPLTPANPQSLEDWERRGDKLFTMRNYEEALQAYHRALEINSEKAVIWLALGDTYFALERHKEALMAYDQAMYLNPDDPQAWANRGTALDALGRHQEAIDCYDRADQLRVS